MSSVDRVGQKITANVVGGRKKSLLFTLNLGPKTLHKFMTFGAQALIQFFSPFSIYAGMSLFIFFLSERNRK